MITTCEGCGGDGYTVGPVCCGDLRDGECWCGSPVPEQIRCDDCGGSGRVEAEPCGCAFCVAPVFDVHPEELAFASVTCGGCDASLAISDHAVGRDHDWPVSRAPRPQDEHASKPEAGAR